LQSSSIAAICETTLGAAAIAGAPRSVAAIDETTLDGFASMATLTGSSAFVTL
jgi:hypothetical protein